MSSSFTPSCLACQLFSCFIKFNYISIPSLWYDRTALEVVSPLFARFSLIDLAGNRSFPQNLILLTVLHPFFEQRAN
jgi:hypothetical protein